MTVAQLVMHHKFNKDYLAQKMGMPVGTLKNKIYDALPQYRFIGDEEVRLLNVLKEIAEDINNAKLETPGK